MTQLQLTVIDTMGWWAICYLLMKTQQSEAKTRTCTTTTYTPQSTTELSSY